MSFWGGVDQHIETSPYLSYPQASGIHVPYYAYFNPQGSVEAARNHQIEITVTGNDIAVNGKKSRLQRLSRDLMREAERNGFPMSEMMIGIWPAHNAEVGTVQAVRYETSRLTPKYLVLVVEDYGKGGDRPGKRADHDRSRRYSERLQFVLPLRGPVSRMTPAYRERTPRRIDTVCRGVFAGTNRWSATHPKSARTYPFRIGPTRNTARQGNTDSDRRTGETQSVPHRQNSHAGPAEQSCGTTAPLPANAGFASTKVSIPRAAETLHVSSERYRNNSC